MRWEETDTFLVQPIPRPMVGGDPVAGPTWTAGFAGTSDSYEAHLATVMEDWI